MEKVTETKIYERFRVGGQIPICGPVCDVAVARVFLCAKELYEPCILYIYILYHCHH